MEDASHTSFNFTRPFSDPLPIRRLLRNACPRLAPPSHSHPASRPVQSPVREPGSAHSEPSLECWHYLPYSYILRASCLASACQPRISRIRAHHHLDHVLVRRRRPLFAFTVAVALHLRPGAHAPLSCARTACHTTTTTRRRIRLHL